MVQNTKTLAVSFKQKQEEKKNLAKKQWKMISTIQVYLMSFAMFDYTIQLITQLPIIQLQNSARYFGFRKIWSWDKSAYTAEQIFSYNNFLLNQGVVGNKIGLELQFRDFGLQVLNCVIISFIALQSEIFNSAGYVKYVTQTDGSMDLLV